MAIKTVIFLSFIILNNFFANMCVKKSCVSPTGILTARHWSLVEATSSVARGAGYSPPIGMLTKMQNGKNTTFSALLRLLNALE